MGFIYCWENKINHKLYIGLTKTTVEDRWKRHLDNATKYYLSDKQYERSPFYRAIRKYGINNFKLKFSYEYVNELLDDYEIFYIMYYNTLTPNGYNITAGGNNVSHGRNMYYVVDAQTKQVIYYDNVINIKNILGINSKSLFSGIRERLKILRIQKQLMCPLFIRDNKILWIVKTLDEILDFWISDYEEYIKLKNNIYKFAGKHSAISREKFKEYGMLGKEFGYLGGMARAIKTKVITNDGRVFIYNCQSECAKDLSIRATVVSRYCRDNKFHKIKSLGCKCKFERIESNE